MEAHWPALEDLFAPWELFETRCESDNYEMYETSWNRALALAGDVTYIVRVDTPVELFDTEVLHSPSPMDAIEDHLLRVGCIVPPSLQEAPVQPVVYGT